MVVYYYRIAYKEKPMPTIEVRLKTILKQRAMTAAALAAKSGVNARTIRDFANGHYTRIGLDILAKICAALDCTPGDLLMLVRNEESAHE